MTSRLVSFGPNTVQSRSRSSSRFYSRSYSTSFRFRFVCFCFCFCFILFCFVLFYLRFRFHPLLTSVFALVLTNSSSYSHFWSCSRPVPSRPVHPSLSKPRHTLPSSIPVHLRSRPPSLSLLPLYTSLSPPLFPSLSPLSPDPLGPSDLDEIRFQSAATRAGSHFRRSSADAAARAAAAGRDGRRRRIREFFLKIGRSGNLGVLTS